MSNLIYNSIEVMPRAEPIVFDEVGVVQTHDQRELARIRDRSVQAVIYIPRVTLNWLANLAVAVETGIFEVPRTILQNVSREEVNRWMEVNFSTTPVGCDVLTALKRDILELVDCFAGLTNASRFMVRIFTGAPTTDCGFHVDTVPPGAAAYGILRVYNGPGTAYVDPANVTSMQDFYHYLSRRERLVRERCVARRNALEDRERLEHEIAQLDSQPAFLRRSDRVHVVPAGSIVVFKHLDITLHWSNHAKERAWIHCSPMQGNPRFVVNITAPQAVPRQLGVIAL